MIDRGGRGSVIVCKQCGTANEDAATFCRSCGAFLEWSGEAVEPGPAASAPEGLLSATPGPPTPTPVADSGMIRCAACGTDNEPIRVYCRRCATELHATPPPTPVVMAAPIARSKAPIGRLVGGAGLAVLAIVATVFLVQDRGLDAAGTPEPGKPSAGAASGQPSGRPAGSLGPATPSDGLTQPPALSRPTGRIVFTLDRNGNADVVAWDAASGEQLVLAGGRGDQSDASWSPDRSQVVHRAAAGLTIVNADGSAPPTPDFTHNGLDRHPAWSPDGLLIAFASTRKPSTGLDIYARPIADTGQLSRLTDHPADDWDPAWSPDGSQIVFVSERNGHAGLFTMRADGSGQRELDLGQGSDELFDDPVFSPDGQWLAFTRRKNVKDLYVVRIDGTGLRRVTDVKATESDPTWSPDGRFIAVVRGGERRVIAIVDVPTGDLVDEIDVEGASSLQPDWR